jgi:hypothetical protein
VDNAILRGLSAQSTLPFDIADLTVRKGAVEYRAITITPKNPMVVGRERIEKLRNSSSVNQVERNLVAQVRVRNDVRIVLFRAKNDAGQRVWQFDSDLDDTMLQDAGAVMTSALLPLHRRLMAAGVMLMVHTDWGRRESFAMREGMRATADRANQGNTPLDAAHHWLLTHMLLHVGLDQEHVTNTLLPDYLNLIDRRWERVRGLIANVPPEAID